MPQGLQAVSTADANLASAAGVCQVPRNQSDLTEAFEQFSELSAQLTQSYQLLENRVSELTTELGVVSDQRLAALQEKEKLADRLENLLHVLPAGVVVLDASGCIASCNPAAMDMLSQPIPGEPWRQVITRCFSPRMDDGHEVSTKDGRKIHIATRSLDHQGQIILLTDNTETRRLQAEVSRQARLTSMGKMVSALAHQIRTPLSAAMLYAGHLTNDNIDSERRQSFSQKLMSRLQHLERQVADMLLFVKGDLVLSNTVTLAELQRKLEEAIEATLQENQVHCQIHNCCPARTIRCNIEVLIGALTNLVNNAIQAAGKACELTIDIAKPEPGTVTIAVGDNGPGLSATQRTAVQEPFVTTKSQGIGLGLSVVQVVAHAHGGSFDLGTSVAGGLSATMRLPLVPGYSPSHSQSPCPIRS